MKRGMLRQLTPEVTIKINVVEPRPVVRILIEGFAPQRCHLVRLIL